LEKLRSDESVLSYLDENSATWQSISKELPRLHERRSRGYELPTSETESIMEEIKKEHRRKKREERERERERERQAK